MKILVPVISGWSGTYLDKILKAREHHNGTVDHLLRAQTLTREMPQIEAVICPTCGQPAHHQYIQVKDPAPITKPQAADQHESAWGSVLEGHVITVSKAFGGDVDSIIKLHRGVGAWPSIFYTIFSSSVKVFLVYEFTQMVLQLSKDWSGTTQFIFRMLMLVGALSVLLLVVAGAGDLASRIVACDLGTRVRSLLRARRCAIRQYLSVLGKRNRREPSVLCPQPAL